MFKADEARQASEEARETIYIKNLEIAEERIKAACALGKTFVDIEELDEQSQRMLREAGYDVFTSTMLVTFEGITKSRPGFKIAW